MLSVNIFIRLLTLLLVTHSILGFYKNDRITNINIVCSEISIISPSVNPALGNFPRCVAPDTRVEKTNTFVENVIDRDGLHVDTSNIKELEVYVANNNFVKFVPANIKKMFPKLASISIMSCGLSHLEKGDLRQFGDDLYYVNFQRNKLTVLQGDLFEFNPKIKYIYLGHNPLQFVDSSFFQSFKNMNINHVMLVNSNCINQHSDSPKITKWNFENCANQETNRKYLHLVDARKEFFKSVYSDEITSDKSQIEELVENVSKLQQQVESMKVIMKLYNATLSCIQTSNSAFSFPSTCLYSSEDKSANSNENQFDVRFSSGIPAR